MLKFSIFNTVILISIILNYFSSFGQSKFVKSIDIEPIITDSTLNIRALEFIKSNAKYKVAFLTSDGRLGEFSINIKDKKEVLPKVKLSSIPNGISDSIGLNFRALSLGKRHKYGITVGNPALLFHLKKKPKIVYDEYHPKVFYDAMEFWNNKEGIAIGDPTGECMSIIITRDGGKTWKKTPCTSIPKSVEGEAAFAASDTNIAIIEDKTWITTGGMASRILFSPDKGRTWQVFDTPIIQGKPTTGIYSIDFYDENTGYAIGGDYTKPDDNTDNKIKTVDGGKTWQIVANGKTPGYRSCIKYIPNSGGNGLVAVGYKGIDYSSDGGNSWTHMSDEGFYTIRFLNENIAIAAGKNRVVKLIFNSI